MGAPQTSAHVLLCTPDAAQDSHNTHGIPPAGTTGMCHTNSATFCLVFSLRFDDFIACRSVRSEDTGLLYCSPVFPLCAKAWPRDAVVNVASVVATSSMKAFRILGVFLGFVHSAKADQRQNCAVVSGILLQTKNHSLKQWNVQYLLQGWKKSRSIASKSCLC